MLRERLLDVVQGPVRADAAPASDGREAPLRDLVGERPLLEHDRLARVPPLDPGGRQVGGGRADVLADREVEVVTLDAWHRPSRGEPELGEAGIDVDVHRTACTLLERGVPQVASGVDEELGVSGHLQRVLEGKTRKALALVADERDRAREPEALDDALEPRDVEAAVVSLSGGADRMHAVAATELIHPDHVIAEPAEPEHPREPLPRDAAVSGKGRDRRAHDETAAAHERPKSGCELQGSERRDRRRDSSL